MPTNNESRNRKTLFADLAQLIEQGKSQLTKQVNSTITVVYWQIGHKINTHILENKRAEYGKQVRASAINNIPSQLVILH